MNIKKMMAKLDLFFDQSKSNQEKKHQKLLRIINKLKKKKSALKKEFKEVHKSKNSKKHRNMCKEYKVIVKLILKAKKQMNSA